MKWTTFILTYLTYSFYHATKVGISYNKAQIMRTFDVTEVYLGFYDFINHVSLTLGVLIRYVVLKDIHDIKWLVMMFAIPVSLGFVTVPTLSYIITSTTAPSQILLTVSQVLALISSAVFGLFSFPMWQLVMILVEQHFTVKEDGSLLGVWSSCSSAGNVLTFFLSNLMIYQFVLRWEVPLFFLMVVYMSVSLLVYFLCKNPPQLSNQVDLSQQTKASIPNHKSRSHTLREKSFFRFFWFHIKNNPEFRYFALAYIGICTAVYSFLLWYPLYLHRKQLHYVSGYISMLFDIGSIVGTFAFGYFYELQDDKYLDHSQTPTRNGLLSFFAEFFLKWRFCIELGVSMGIMLVYMFLSSNSVWIYCVLTFTFGFLICGIFYTVATHETILFAPNDSFTLQRLSSINIALSEFSIGLFQLLIGVFLKKQTKGSKSQKTSYNSFFYILIFMIVLTCLFFFLKTKEKHKRQKYGLSSEDDQ